MIKKVLAAIGIIAVIVGIAFFFFTKNNNVTYIVTFKSDDNTVFEEQIIKKGEKAEKPEDPIKDGFLFVEWEYNNESFDFSTVITEDIILNARWVEEVEDVEMITIKFETDGGTTISNQIIEKGSKVVKPEDPTKEGYVFKGWTIDDEEFDFLVEVVEDIVIVAKWEKDEKIEDKQSSDKKNNNTSNKTQQTKPSKNEVKLKTPVITQDGFGLTADGSKGILLKLNSTEGITGVKIYSATTKNGTYTLQKTVKKGDWNNSTATVQALKGQHLYFKVKTYVKNASGTFNSDYSNIIELDNSLSTPTITKDGFGVTYDGSYGMALKLDLIEGITGVEVYSATTKNGTYTLQKTVKTEDLNNQAVSVTALKGQHLYFKVRTYVKNSAGTFYSGYSNVMELNNSLVTPEITREFLGTDIYDNVGYGLKLNIVESGVTGVEVYSSASENGTYTLSDTILVDELVNEVYAQVNLSKGQHFYYKVRTYSENEKGKFYSGFSNVVEADNS